MLSVRSLAQSCLSKSVPLSVIPDVHGVYKGGIPTSPNPLSLRQQLRLISSKPFIRLAMFHVWPASSSERVTPLAHYDMRDASNFFLGQCGVWLFVTSVEAIHTDRFGPQVTINTKSGELSQDEKDLFALGRNAGADIIGFYVGDAKVGGRGSHSARAFWIKRTQDFRAFALAHELGHAAGDLKDVTGGPTSNLMCAGANCVWEHGPTFTDEQRKKFSTDPIIRACGASLSEVDRTAGTTPFVCGGEVP
jgi:hypothetical protein